MDIAAGIASLDAALKIAKGLRDIEKAYDQVTLKGQVVDVPLSFHPAATRVLGLVTPRSVG